MMTTTIRALIQSLAVAALLAASLNLPAGPARAESTDEHGQPPLCVSYGQDGSINFHVPGGTVTGESQSIGSKYGIPNPAVIEGKGGNYKYQCSSNGYWVQVPGVRARPTIVAPQPGGVLSAR
jgi:hypothetical protein